MRALFLDLSRTAIGWAVDSPQGGHPPLAGTRRPRFSEQKRGDFGHEYQQWLYKFLVKHKVDFVGYEAPIAYTDQSRRNPETRRIQHDFNEKMLLFGLAFATECIAASRKLQYKEGHVQTIRKVFVGHGRPQDPKETVRAKCDDLGWPVANFDEADAVAGWVWAKHTYDKSFVWHGGLPLLQSRVGNGG